MCVRLAVNILILGIRWFHFVTNASVTSQTGEEGLAIWICRKWLSIFGHVRRLPKVTPAHSALRLAVDARTGGKPDIRPEWKRQRGRPCWTWVQQIEDDTGFNANDAWRIAHDRKSWRALRPVAGQAFHWLTNWLILIKSKVRSAYYGSFQLWPLCRFVTWHSLRPQNDLQCVEWDVKLDYNIPPQNWFAVACDMGNSHVTFRFPKELCCQVITRHGTDGQTNRETDRQREMDSVDS